MPLPPRPHALLFDLDDTLWPIAPVIARAELSLFAWLQAHAPRVAARFSIEALRDARMAMLARAPHAHVDLAALRRAGLLAAFAEAGEDGELVAAAMDHFLAARNAVQPYDDVLPGLARLRGRYQLGTISNGNADLRAIGLDHLFSVSLAAHEHGSAKPDPGIFVAACQLMDVAPRDAVYIGDDVLLDVRGAQQAGLRAVWLNRVGSAAHLEHGVAPDAICADFDALIAWLDGQHACA